MHHFILRFGRVAVVPMMLVAALASFTLLNTHAAHADSSPNYVPCDAGWVYDNLTDNGVVMHAVVPRQSVTNTLGYDITDTFSVTVSTATTVSVSTTATIEVDANAIISGVKASVSGTVSASLTVGVSTTNSPGFTVHNNSTVYGDYGVYQRQVYGHYYHINQRCNIDQDDGYITTFSPASIGWNIYAG